jgi:hypothetical protein
MAASSVRDLVIKEDDLVVGTHGRDVWILDDITPLRRIDATTAQQEVVPSNKRSRGAFGGT